MPLITCPSCTHRISSDAFTCPSCGHPVRGSINTFFVLQKSRSTAALFAIFLGCFGAHKFYLNKPGEGVLYLIFCWTFLPGVIGFFEGLRYAFMNEADFHRQYG